MILKTYEPNTLRVLGVAMENCLANKKQKTLIDQRKTILT